MSTHHTDIICMKVINEKKELTETYLSAKPDIYSNQLSFLFSSYDNFKRNNIHIELSYPNKKKTLHNSFL